ncbi:MAG: DUF3298/DUF4163 domain-containing protein [Legionella sp.]|nr:MAG: DUF3298/DUF4163 domain-containing protein [Legionella sp.]
MNTLHRQFGILFFSFALLWLPSLAMAVSNAVVQKETEEYLLNLKYPEGFAAVEVNTKVKEYIKDKRSEFMKELVDDAGVSPDAPGKTSLTINYKIVYNAKNALSIRFDRSIYHRGAAHPAHFVEVLNFLNNKEISLSDLFKQGADYLNPIASYCSKEITAKDISDAELIKEGTAPTVDNYSTWYFTTKGIAVVFNTYQVAAYVYGEQVVPVPLSIFASVLKPELAKSLWGNA